MTNPSVSDNKQTSSQSNRPHLPREAAGRARHSQGPRARAWTDLAHTYRELAKEKQAAARAEHGGRAFDWSRYERLSLRRDKITQRLETAGAL